MDNKYCLQRAGIVCVILGLWFSLAARDLTVVGTVVGADDKPIENALVFLTDSPNDPTIDTATTKADGTFEKKVTVTEFSRTLYYAVHKEGLEPKTGSQRLTGGNNRVDLGKIVVGAPGPSRTIVVLGKCINARTQKPIEKAMVLLSKMSMGGTPSPADTIFTDAQGSFVGEVKVDSGGIGSMRPMVSYKITKEGYRDVNSTTRPRNDTTDLGTIRMTPLAVSIQNAYNPLLSYSNADNVLVYSMKGQLLFSGAVKTFHAKKHALPNCYQPHCIRYRKNKTVLHTEMVVKSH